MKNILLTLLLFLTLSSAQEEPLFTPLGIPREGDWLYSFDEKGQSFDDFLNCEHNVPDSIRNEIHLVPLEQFDSSLIAMLLDVTAAYFGINAKALPNTVDTTVLEHRTEVWGKQYHTDPIMDSLKSNLEPNSFCAIAITGNDLYPGEGWNFVFGMGDFTERVGVFSFHRYATRDSVLFRKRCAKIITHEIGHMFGLRHCVVYRCNMNGSNSLSESDSQPLFLCPECLVKLNHSVPFNREERYLRLKELFEREKFTSEVEWLSKRLKALEMKRLSALSHARDSIQ